MFLTRSPRLLFNVLLSLAYPQPCSLCGASVESRDLGVVCENCWAKATVFNGRESICWKCGVVARGIVSETEREEVSCRRCGEQAFTAARACGIYDGALRESVLRLKREPYIPSRLADLVTATARRSPLDLSTRIMPVPLHPERLRVRGFNQASVVASRLAKSLRLPLDEITLCRTRSADKYRAGLDMKGRRDTVTGAFLVRYPMLVAGEDVLLVDDVFTTGATADSCAGVLLAAGARNVFVLTIARPAY